VCNGRFEFHSWNGPLKWCKAAGAATNSRSLGTSWPCAQSCMLASDRSPSCRSSSLPCSLPSPRGRSAISFEATLLGFPSRYATPFPGHRALVIDSISTRHLGIGELYPPDSTYRILLYRPLKGLSDVMPALARRPSSATNRSQDSGMPKNTAQAHPYSEYSCGTLFQTASSGSHSHVHTSLEVDGG
jgi:hypothetical protein